MKPNRGLNEQGNPLLDYFVCHNGRVIHKWLHYFDIYHRHLKPYRDRPVQFLEIGMQNGGSTLMWKDYFHPDSEIIASDIDPACKKLEQIANVEVWIGDQADEGFWNQFKTKHASLDIVLDDGGHTMQQQITTFLSLFPILSEGGIYICEDTHTSYLPAFGGGLNNTASFLEFVKNLVDDIHQWYFASDAQITANYITQNLYSIHIYDSMVVMEKRKKMPPMSLHQGIDGHVLPQTVVTLNHKMVRGY